MAVAKELTLQILDSELKFAKRIGTNFGWEFSEVNPAGPSFRVHLSSNIDKEVYVMDFACDDYKEKPPLIEFVYPKTKENEIEESGTTRCYPLDSNSEVGAIFHNKPCICHPCSRKAYGKLGGPHGDWDDKISNWITLANGIDTIGAMIMMVQGRINLEGSYKGRMAR